MVDLVKEVGTFGLWLTVYPVSYMILNGRRGGYTLHVDPAPLPWSVFSQ